MTLRDGSAHLRLSRVPEQFLTASTPSNIQIAICVSAAAPTPSSCPPSCRSACTVASITSKIRDVFSWITDRATFMLKNVTVKYSSNTIRYAAPEGLPRVRGHHLAVFHLLRLDRHLLHHVIHVRLVKAVALQAACRTCALFTASCIRLVKTCPPTNACIRHLRRVPHSCGWSSHRYPSSCLSSTRRN